MTDLSITYWGIMCRTCKANIAFGVDAAAFSGTGVTAAVLNTGVYRCLKSHRHVYYLGDEVRFTSPQAVTAMDMQINRAAYRSLASELAADSARVPLLAQPGKLIAMQ